MDIAWTISEFFLQFTNAPLIIIILCLAIHSHYKQATLSAFSLLCFNAILARYLKMLFRIPLPASLGIVDYAFPSGHMLIATSLYGFLAYHRHRLDTYASVSVLLLGIALGLIHHGYHNLYDVSAAIAIAVATITYLHRPLIRRYNSTLTLLIVGALVLILTIPHSNPIPQSKTQHIWLHLGFLMGCTYHSKHYTPPDRIEWLAYSLHSMLAGAVYFCGITLHNAFNLAPIYLVIPGYLFSYWVLSTHTRPNLQNLILNTIGTYRSATS